jgi:hypothetical protein
VAERGVTDRQHAEENGQATQLDMLR